MVVEREESVHDEDLEKWFSAFAQGSQTLSASSLRSALEAAGLLLTWQCVNSLIKMMDGRGDGRITAQEFCTLYRFIESIRNSFVQVDSRGDKKLQIHDVALALNQYSQRLAFEALSMLFRVFDKGSKGYLILPEYIELAVFVTCARHLYESCTRENKEFIKIDQNALIQFAVKLR
ncbi:hypothetical protein NDN08_002026 [Rhodosorus marinus]|uniref:EF-hand domain-containing protein n=1 Tax=Rhodosorus marinus TaxID=101924 RepID=A0AAV8USM4_9RHOD|nr:hypothetical protein NDN08_002026 [Rhodosorus marinus]